MTKELFVDSINAIQRQTELNIEVSMHLGKAFPDAFEANLMPRNHIIQDALIQVRVDSSSKQLFVQDVDKELVNLGVTRGFEAFLKSNTTVAKKTIGSQTIYKLTFDQNTKYSSMEMWVNTKDLLVNKYILYAGREIYDDSKEEESWIKPRMEVVVKNYAFAEKVNQVDTKKITDFFSDTNLLVPTKKYMDFEVIDLRNKTK